MECFCGQCSIPERYDTMHVPYYVKNPNQWLEPIMREQIHSVDTCQTDITNLLRKDGNN